MTTFDHRDHTGLKNVLMGQKVVQANIQTGELTLSDGKTLTLRGNEGCFCGAGDYDLTELNTCDNIITNVEVAENPAGEDYDDKHGRPDDRGTYRIFVYAENRKVNLATFEGTDGNGYYGTGFWVHVRKEA